MEQMITTNNVNKAIEKFMSISELIPSAKLKPLIESDMATEAKLIPITIITGPVTTAGNILLSLFAPIR